MMLVIYKEMSDKFSLTDVANEFCFANDERSQLFGHFCQNEMCLNTCTF